MPSRGARRAVERRPVVCTATTSQCARHHPTYEDLKMQYNLDDIFSDDQSSGYYRTFAAREIKQQYVVIRGDERGADMAAAVVHAKECQLQQPCRTARDGVPRGHRKTITTT